MKNLSELSLEEVGNDNGAYMTRFEAYADQPAIMTSWLGVCMELQVPKGSEFEKKADVGDPLHGVYLL